MLISPILLSGLPRALAYLDPGSGSLIIQMLIAAVVGGGLLLRTFWSKIFGKGKSSEDELGDVAEDIENHQS